MLVPLPRVLQVIALLSLSLSSASAQDEPSPVKVAESGIIWAVGPDMSPAELKVDEYTKASVATLDDGKTPAIKLDFVEHEGFPGVNFPPPPGGWDFTGFTGVQVEVTNPNADVAPVVFLQLKGDKRPDESPRLAGTSKKIEPGETAMLELDFTAAGGNLETELNPANIQSIRLFVGNTPHPMTLLVTSVKAY